MNFMTDIIHRVVSDKPSEVIESIMHSLPEDNEEACSEFCDEFELGNWFYESLIENQVNIIDELEKIRVSNQLDEEMAMVNYRETERDLRAMNGWNI